MTSTNNDDAGVARTAVIGPGAIGSTIAAALVDAGHRPVIGARTPFERLAVRHGEGVVEAKVTCFGSPSEVGDNGPVDVAFLAVKAHQTEAAAGWLDAFVGPTTTLVILQNGVEHIERLEPFVADGVDLVPAVVALPATRGGPGQVAVTGRSRITIPAGPSGDRVAGLFAESFLNVKLSDDWTTDAWIKLMMNAASGGLCTLARTDNRVFADEQATHLAIDVMNEVAEVGRAYGARLATDLPDRIMTGLAAQASGHMSSIVVDRINGVPTEWDARNGVVCRLAARHGIDVPLNQMLTTLIRIGEPSTPPPT